MSWKNFNIMLIAALLFAYSSGATAQTGAEITYRDMRSRCFINYTPSTNFVEDNDNVALVEYSVRDEKCAVVFNYEGCCGYFSNHDLSFHPVDAQDSVYADYIKVYDWVNDNSNIFDSTNFRRGGFVAMVRKIKFSLKREDGTFASYTVDANNYDNIADSELSASMESIISEINLQQISLKDIIFTDETNN